MVEAESLPAVGLSEIKREEGGGGGEQKSTVTVHVQQRKHLQTSRLDIQESLAIYMYM